MGAPQTSENTHTNEFGNKSEMRNTKKKQIYVQDVEYDTVCTRTSRCKPKKILQQQQKVLRE